MPFLPVVLLVAWQAIGRSASFLLGWATALYFGQVPGRQGRILSILSLVAAAWVILVGGFGLPMAAGAALQSAGVIDRNFSVSPLVAGALLAAILATPPIAAAAAIIGEFQHERSLGAWLRLVPVSYPATFMLGLSVLLMIAIAPVLLVQRWRRKRTLLEVPLMMREGTDDDDLVAAIETAIRSVGMGDIAVREAQGPKTWPMRTLGFAARHLLGAVVRGDPMELAVDGLEIYAYATNVAVLGPKGEAHRVRAAIEREIALTDAYLTWDAEAQGFERALRDIDRSSNGDAAALVGRLDALQAKIDAAALNSEEWNVLYRERLQVEQRAARQRP